MTPWNNDHVNLQRKHGHKWESKAEHLYKDIFQMTAFKDLIVFNICLSMGHWHMHKIVLIAGVNMQAGEILNVWFMHKMIKLQWPHSNGKHL